MKRKRHLIPVLSLLLLLMGAVAANSQILVQCPPDTDGIDTDGDGIVNNDHVCMHLAAGDGFLNMADGRTLYSFGFSQVPLNVPPDMVMEYGMLKAELPAPTITVKEGQKLYLNLTNVGMMMRPDLFDPHSIHWHGFPNASSFFDGEPMASFGTNMGASFTYFYNVVEAGTFMYHCHVEATEHMQMGMLGNLYVKPKQDNNAALRNLGALRPIGVPYTGFAYNDGDGSTGYDVAYPVQFHAFDPNFHEASINIQPLEFAYINDKYAMFNGRGYPDTVNTAQLGQNADNNNYPSQKVHSRITATSGQKILLRLSNLSFDFYTVTALGLPLKVVGKDAKLLRGPTGINLSYDTASISLGGGEAADVIVDTAGITPGTYFLYTTNLNYLSNDSQERGGMMTEIVIN
jgi:FtsP/CotA-like multicopper oxidase with cupredoxin domain